MKIFLIVIGLIAIIMASPARSGEQFTYSTGVPGEAAGKWRVCSARICYDQGSGGSLGRFSGILELNDAGQWLFGKSTGAFAIDSVSDDDWKRWGINPYGPRRKITLSRWCSTVADGPIEESNGIEYVWVIYRVSPPTTKAPGTVWLKLGRVAHLQPDEEE
jgi:hypothetical protein